MNSFYRGRLRAKVTFRIPAIIKHDKHSLNSMTCCNCEELIHSSFEGDRILLPDKRMNKYSDDLKPKALSISKFPIDSDWVECFCLPHLEYINSRARNKVAASKPSRLSPPIICLCNSPLRSAESYCK